jgi:hypothetical protein
MQLQLLPSLPSNHRRCHPGLKKQFQDKIFFCCSRGSSSSFYLLLRKKLTFLLLLQTLLLSPLYWSTDM